MIRLEGTENIMRNLQHAADKIEGKLTMKGLIEAGIIIRRDMDPLIPIDTGNLRASWFTVTAHTNTGEGRFKGENAAQEKSRHEQAKAAGKALATAHRKPIMLMGFSASYAIPVHERPGVTFRKKSAEPKFFEKSLNRTKDQVLHTLQQNAKI